MTAAPEAAAGAAAPFRPVVLIGALGGMITSGVLGLFIGPVMLAVGYRLPLMSLPWVDEIDYPYIIEQDPFEERAPLAAPPNLALTRPTQSS